MAFDNEVQESFNEHYRSGNTPWDSGISPPELLAAVTGPTALVPGRMLDIGCGTGTNCLTLALLGWQTVGVDFVPLAIERANQKAAALADEIARAGGSVSFKQADVTQLPAPDERYTLLLDLGCLNGVPPPLRAGYARVVAQQAMPGALFLLYAHFPGSNSNRPPGCTPEEIDRLLGAEFRLERRELGTAPQGGSSMWNWLRRLSQ
jgi:SAM-dependent methyltransferase